MIKLLQKKYTIKKAFQSENNTLTLSVTGGKSEILIAGTKKSSTKKIYFSARNSLKIALANCSL